MTRSHRHYLIDDGEIRPISHAVIERVRRQGAALPKYAGKDLKVLDLTLEGGKVTSVTPSLLKLDAKGKAKSELMDQLRASLKPGKPKAPWIPSDQHIARAIALATGRVKSKAAPIKAG